MKRAQFVLVVICAGLGCGDDGGTDGTRDAGADMGDSPLICTTDEDCDNEVFCDGEELCMPGAEGADARGCLVGTDSSPCLEGQTCDEGADACVTDCDDPDADGDGRNAMECGGDDCDDSDPTRYPGNAETCDPDNKDEDCDPSTFGYRDQDSDGYPDQACCNSDESSGTEVCGTDCDDLNALVHPTEAEACDGFDNDCNGMVDDGLAFSDYYPDCDRDDHGDDSAEPVRGCLPPAPAPAHCPSGQFATAPGDCADNDAAVSPTSVEVCDLIDNDCNTIVDDRVDSEGEPFPCSCDVPGQVRTCGTDEGNCTMGTQTCTGGAWTACDGIPPARVETCDLSDEDCDGKIDEQSVDRDTLYPDLDGDGFGDTTQPILSCPMAGYTTRAGDCRDAASSDDPLAGAVNPAASEVCYDGIDNNCNPGDDDTDCACPGLGMTTSCGFGPGETYETCDGGPCVVGSDTSSASTCRSGSRICQVGGNWSTVCEGLVGPAADGPPSSCDGEDDDCDGTTDEGCGCTDGMTQQCGLSEGECELGLRTCSGGEWSSLCEGGVTPIPEICDGRDNDCDGSLDNGCPCVVGDDRVCGSDVGRCSPGLQACESTSGGASSAWTTCGGAGYIGSRAELSGSRTCNNLDDDCDGRIDEAPECGSGPVIGTDFDTTRFNYSGVASGRILALAGNAGSIATKFAHQSTAITELRATFDVPGTTSTGGAVGEAGVGWFRGTGTGGTAGEPTANGLFAVIDQTDAMSLHIYWRVDGSLRELATAALSSTCSRAGQYRLLLVDDPASIRATLYRDSTFCASVRHNYVGDDFIDLEKLTGAPGSRRDVYYGAFADDTNTTYPVLSIDSFEISLEGFINYGPCDLCNFW